MSDDDRRAWMALAGTLENWTPASMSAAEVFITFKHLAVALRAYDAEVSRLGDEVESLKTEVWERNQRDE